MRSLIICLIGESGSGKSTIAEALERDMNIPTLRSYTERPKRDEKDTGHTFLTTEEFNQLKQTDMIAFTRWEGNRYCCLKKDVTDVCTYVIDEYGYKYLLSVFGDEYNIVSIRLIRSYKARLRSVGKKRISRDKGKFTMGINEFDYLLENYHDDMDKIIEHAETLVRYILSIR